LHGHLFCFKDLARLSIKQLNNDTLGWGLKTVQPGKRDFLLWFLAADFKGALSRLPTRTFTFLGSAKRSLAWASTVTLRSRLFTGS
jgi:hypothetical protein